MNYKILWDKNRTRLEQKVIDALKDGWELVGGASMSTTTTNNIEVFAWSQTLIKRG